MNHDFICYIIISTIKIPHRLKNNFRYNYTVILYNNIIFRFSFQIRCSDEHTPRSGSEKIHFFFVCCKFHIDFCTQCYLFFCVFCNAKVNTLETIEAIGRSRRHFLSRVRYPTREKKREKKTRRKEESPFRVCPVSISIFSPFFSFLLKYFRVACTLARHFPPRYRFSFFSSPLYFSEIYRNIGLERSNVVFTFFFLSYLFLVTRAFARLI